MCCASGSLKEKTGSASGIVKQFNGIWYAPLLLIFRLLLHLLPISHPVAASRRRKSIKETILMYSHGETKLSFLINMAPISLLTKKGITTECCSGIFLLFEEKYVNLHNLFSPVIFDIWKDESSQRNSTIRLLCIYSNKSLIYSMPVYCGHIFINNLNLHFITGHPWNSSSGTQTKIKSLKDPHFRFLLRLLSVCLVIKKAQPSAIKI